MIKFKLIKFKNFLSYGNEFTEFDLSNTKKTLIIGTNGSGKSTILDALTFALYSKPFRKINKPQLVNSINNKGCEVIVEFSIGETEYRIRRGLKPAVFEIFKNNELIDQNRKADDYQNLLETQILKKSYKTFTQIDILGSAKYTSFMELLAPQRREVIEDLLDLQIFSDMNVVTKRKISETDTEINDNEKKLLKAENEVDKIKIASSTSVTIFEEQQRQILTNKLSIEQQITEQKTYKFQLSEKLKELPELIDITDILQKQNEFTLGLSKINDKINQINQEVTFFKNNDNCPTCKQKIDDLFKSETLEAKELKIVEYKDLSNKIQINQSKNKDSLEKASHIKEMYDDLILKISIIDNKITQLNNDLNRETSVYYQLDIKIKEAKKAQVNELSSALSEVNNINDILSKLKKKQQHLKMIIASLKDTGVKTLIISEYIPLLNQQINKYLKMMDFMVSFNLSETFEETIKSRYRDDFTYGSFSEGQKSRINLAILFAFRDIARKRNSVASNILFFDEILDGSLDDQGAEDFMNIIDILTNDVNVFIISHKTDNISDRFDQTLSFKMVKNFSKKEIL